jgi:hypothetical protein
VSKSVGFLRVDLYETTEHPQAILKRLGITYQVAVPQSLLDCWHFWNCENVPDELPACINIREREPTRSACLSPEQIAGILAYRAAKETAP